MYIWFVSPLGQVCLDYDEHTQWSMFISLLQQLGCLCTASEESPLGVSHLFGQFFPLVKCSCTLEKGVVGSAPEQAALGPFRAPRFWGQNYSSLVCSTKESGWVLCVQCGLSASYILLPALRGLLHLFNVYNIKNPFYPDMLWHK